MVTRNSEWVSGYEFPTGRLKIRVQRMWAGHKCVGWNAELDDASSDSLGSNIYRLRLQAQTAKTRLEQWKIRQWKISEENWRRGKCKSGKVCNDTEHHRYQFFIGRRYSLLCIARYQLSSACMSVCLSVRCPSHAGTVSKRRKPESGNLHRGIAQGL